MFIRLNSREHKTLKVDNSKPALLFSQYQFAPVYVNEYLKVGLNLPILFLKDETSTSFQSICLMGLEKNENLIFTETENYTEYLPTYLQALPFTISFSDHDTPDIPILFNPESPAFSQGVHSLFHDDGSPTELLEDVKSHLAEMGHAHAVTHDFLADIAQYDVFKPIELTIKQAGTPVTALKGAYIIDEEKLNALDENTLALWSKNNYLKAIHAHLMSLGKINTLIHLKYKRDHSA